MLKRGTADTARFEQRDGQEHGERYMGWSAVDIRRPQWGRQDMISSERSWQQRSARGYWVSIDALCDPCICEMPPESPPASPLLPSSPSALSSFFHPLAPPQPLSTNTRFVQTFFTRSNQHGFYSNYRSFNTHTITGTLITSMVCFSSPQSHCPWV